MLAPSAEDAMNSDLVEPVARRRTLNADVLIVDDDPDVRHSTSEILESSGLTVAEAEDGDVALRLLRDHHYRLLLIDLRMPRMDGVSLIEALGDRPPVVVHTAYTVTPAEQRRLGGKVVGYLRKPVSPRQLLDAVRSVLADQS
jgi:CheY-like chemotaxis protein